MRDSRDRRIAELERQLLDVRKSAVSIIVTLADAMARTSDERDELVQTFEEAAEIETGEKKHLARLVAAALRAK